MSETTVHTTGPLFDGRAMAAVDRYAHDVKGKLGEVAVNRVRMDLSGVLRTNTGRYESKIHVEMDGDDVMVTDTVISYGPWLEGVGSRNASTRFPGYHVFRLVGRELNKDATSISDDFLRSGGYLQEMS